MDSQSVSWEQICDLYRDVCLNVKYYGCRAARLAFWNKAFLVAAAIGSSGTVIALIKGVSTKGEIVRIVLAVVAAVAVTVMPLLGLSEKAKDFSKLHFIYSELSSQIAILIQQIQRRGVISDQDMAALHVLQQLYGHLASEDEPKPSRKLIDQLTVVVNRAIPPESLVLQQQ